jgi:hypothetical protein
MNTSRAAIISDRLWHEGRRAWTAALNEAIVQGITLLELIERRVCEWERNFEMAKREERR